MKIYYIYIHTTLDTNRVFYVGKGKNKRAWVKQHRNSRWTRIVNKHGYKVEILIQNLTEEDALNEEVRFIKLYKAIGQAEANLTDGGEGSSGWHPSDETKRKISESLKKLQKIGEKSASWGKKFSEETKNKMREKAKKRNPMSYSRGSGSDNPLYGSKHKEETKEKMKASNKHYWEGKKFSEETKKKMQNAHKGGKHHKAKKVIDIITNKVWDCIRDASVDTRINYNILCKYLNGKCKNETTLRYLES